MTRRLARRTAAALVALVALSGCGFKGAYSLPLPGGNAGGSSYRLTAYFDDVQDLVPMSAVRVDDVPVGDVTGITYDPAKNQARVSMRIKKSVRLPDNSRAVLEQTTLLGEKYVQIERPTVPAAGMLADGGTIGSTSNLPDVEQVFGLLSNVLNGGDLQDLQTINVEIAKALSGREQTVRAALASLDTFVSDLDGQKHQIVRALDALDRFSGRLAQQNGTIATALDDLGPGLKVLADERSQFTGLLTDLSRFGRVATHVIRSSRSQTIAGLRDLQPILQHLAAAGTNLPHSLELLVTYPFPKNVDKAIPGDYNGLYLSFNADPVFCALAEPLKGTPFYPPTCKTSQAPVSPGGVLGKTKNGVKLPKLPTKLPKLPKLPKVPGLPKLPVHTPDPTDLLGNLLDPTLPGGGR